MYESDQAPVVWTIAPAANTLAMEQSVKTALPPSKGDLPQQSYDACATSSCVAVCICMPEGSLLGAWRLPSPSLDRLDPMSSTEGLSSLQNNK